MNHLEQKNVVFTGSVARQVVDNGVVRKYYRNSFLIDGKTAQASYPDDVQGLSGVVAFVKKGELGPTGQPVMNDCFTIVSVSSIQGVVNQIQMKKLNTELLAL